MTVKQLNNLISVKNCKIVLIYIGILYLATFFNRYIQTDENWLGEQAYWLVKEGKVKLKSLPFILNWTQEFLVYHKLLIWIGAGIITVFGWSVFYFKFFNLVCFLTTLCFIWRITASESKRFQFVSLILFLTIPIILIKSFEFRPEVPVMMFGLGSFFFLRQYLISNKVGQALVGGLLSGLAFLTHLNGAVFCVSGFFLLLYFRNIKGLAFFSLVAISVCLIYFIPLFEGNNLELWAYNLKNVPSHDFSSAINQNIFETIFEKIITEQKRFFWDESVAGISLIFILVLLFKGKFLWKNYKVLLLFTIFQITFLALLGSHKAARYLMFHLPFMAMIIAYAWREIAKSGKVFQSYLLLALAICQFALFSRTAWQITSYNAPQSQIHQEIMSHIPKASKVIGPWELIYNEISNYEIYTFKSYEYLEEKMPKPFTQIQLTQKIASLGIEYIILDINMKEDKVNHWFKNWEVDPQNIYQEYYKNNNYLILKRYSN